MDNIVNTLVTEYNMKVHIFNSRYSEGIIAVVTATSEQAEVIEDQFTSGDDTAANISNSLSGLSWFPIVYLENANLAIVELVKKLNTIFQDISDIRQWCLRVELVGNIVERDQTKLLLQYLTDLNKRSPFTQEELLFLLRDYGDPYCAGSGKLVVSF